MEKITIKNIFCDNDGETKPESINENKQDKRIKDLAKRLDAKNEVYKTSDELISDVSPEQVQKEFDRFKKIARIDEANVALTHPQGGLNKMGPGFNNPTVGTSVASFMGDMPGKTVNTFLENPNLYLANKNYNPNYTYLQPNEALRLSISRTLTSGAPVAEMSFYDEVNWNLNNLGFDSKSPLDIKQTILKMIKD